MKCRQNHREHIHTLRVLAFRSRALDDGLRIQTPDVRTESNLVSEESGASYSITPISETLLMPARRRRLGADGMIDPYSDAREFARLFGRFEFALKRGGFLANKRVAEADWLGFAEALGENFFYDVVRSNIAKTLIENPPRKLLNDGTGPAWQSAPPAPLTSVRELIICGVCRVRNSYIHGEKFTGSAEGGDWTRDGELIAEALAVLKLAATRIEPVAAILGQERSTLPPNGDDRGR